MSHIYLRSGPAGTVKVLMATLVCTCSVREVFLAPPTQQGALLPLHSCSRCLQVQSKILVSVLCMHILYRVESNHIKILLVYCCIIGKTPTHKFKLCLYVKAFFMASFKFVFCFFWLLCMDVGAGGAEGAAAPPKTRL